MRNVLFSRRNLLIHLHILAGLLLVASISTASADCAPPGAEESVSASPEVRYQYWAIKASIHEGSAQLFNKLPEAVAAEQAATGGPMEEAYHNVFGQPGQLYGLTITQAWTYCDDLKFLQRSGYCRQTTGITFEMPYLVYHCPAGGYKIKAPVFCEPHDTPATLFTCPSWYGVLPASCVRSANQDQYVIKIKGDGSSFTHLAEVEPGKRTKTMYVSVTDCSGNPQPKVASVNLV